MRGHLQCRDTLAGNQGCPLKTGTTVMISNNVIGIYAGCLRSYAGVGESPPAVGFSPVGHSPVG